MSKFKTYLGKEIGIEYKACLYFFAILLYQCCYLLITHTFSVEIIKLAEIIIMTYAMGYLQVFCFKNFDEGERLDANAWVGMIVGIVLYNLVGYLCEWFDRNLIATLIFIPYMLLLYVCTYMVNKTKRKIDTEQLNDLLKKYQNE